MAQREAEILRRELDRVGARRGPCFSEDLKHRATAWERLTRFVENPLVPLDNNATERAIRGPVVGRKNHYGSESRRGTEVAAILYSLVETAKLHDIDPAKYVLEAVRAVDRGEILLPWQMAAAENQASVKTG